MKYCAFFLREKFIKTFFIFVFILLGFLTQTQQAFGEIVKQTWLEKPPVFTDPDAPYVPPSVINGVRLGENLFSLDNLQPAEFTEGRVIEGDKYKIGTVAANGKKVRITYNNSKDTPNASGHNVEWVEVWEDGKYYNFKVGKFENGTVSELQPSERIMKNVQGANGVFNQFYTPQHDKLLDDVQKGAGIQFDDERTLKMANDLSDGNTQFTEDWKKSLYKLTEGKNLTDAQKDEIYNAVKASYLKSATPEQNALLENLSQQDANKDVIKKINEGGAPKYVSKTYKEDLTKAETPEEVAKAAEARGQSGDSGLCPIWDSSNTAKIVTATVTLVTGPVGGALASQIFGNGNLFNCVEQVLYVILYILSIILGFVGMLFNTVFDYTVVGMSGFVERLTVINSAWEAFRDLANILFIFLLLYLSIQTILQTDSGEVKHTLSKLIIVALLLNFSLFFTKVIIDSSNILTVTIYEKVAPGDGAFKLGDAFMATFNFQKLYGQAGYATGNGASGDFLGVKFNTDAAKAFAAGTDVWSTFIMGSIMIIITIFVFTAVIAIFVKRLVVLILLMITAPLAFVASIFPKTSGMVEEMWWGNLIRNAFYAPLFMMFMWVSLRILNEPSFKDQVFKGDDFIANIFGFTIAIAFLIISLIAAESLHVAGAHTAMKWYGGMQGWVGKNTVGRAVYNLLEKGETGHFLYETAAEGLRSKQLDKLRKIPVVGSWAGDLYNAGTKKAAQTAFGLSHHAASSDFSSIPFMGGGHGDHGGGDHKAGGYAKKVQDEADKQKAWWNEQKGKPDAWIEAFKKIDASGKSHEGKVLERVSEQWDDKVELVQAMDFGIEDLEEEVKNAKNPKEKEIAQKNLDNLKNWRVHLMGGMYEAGKQKGKPSEGRFTAKEQDRVNKGLEGATINHRTRFDKLSKEIGNGTGPDAEKNIKRTRDFYRTLNPKQKVGLRVDQYTNPHVVDLNIDSNVFEQAQREAKMSPETTDTFGKIGFSAASRNEAYKKYEDAKKTNDSVKIQEAEKELFDKFKYLGQHYISQLEKINTETDSTKKEDLKTKLIETYRDTRSKGEAKLGKYFEATGGRWYDRPPEFPEKTESPQKPNVTQQATAQIQTPPTPGQFFG